MMPINPIQLMQMKNNPAKFAQGLLANNPNIKNADKIAKAIQMYNNNDQRGLQQLANEVCNAQGASSEMVGSYIKNQYGI